LIVISPQQITFDIEVLGPFIYFFWIVLFIQIIGVAMYINYERNKVNQTELKEKR